MISQKTFGCEISQIVLTFTCGMHKLAN